MSRYWSAGTAVAESFWSVSDSLPLDWTGLTMKTRPVPVEEPLPPLVAPAGAAVARGTQRAAAMDKDTAARTAGKGTCMGTSRIDRTPDILWHLEPQRQIRPVDP